MLNLFVNASLLGLILTVVLPTILGLTWLGILNFYFRATSFTYFTSKDGVCALLLGYGYIIGLFVVTLILRIWNAFGWKLDFVPISILLWILILSAIWILPKTFWYSLKKYSLFSFSYNIQAVLISLLLIWIGIRLIYLGSEMWLRPLYPWDAWFAWGQKTATWFELRQLTPFAVPENWPGTVNAPIFTAPAYSYPPTIPLIQVWTLLGLDQWDDALMNLPWLMCWIALGLGVYGQARQWGVSSLAALIWVYLLLSLPMLNVHIAIAGYADIWLATGYGFTLMAILLWIQQRQSYQIWLSVFSAIFTLQTKSEGLAWLITLIPTVLIAIGFKTTSVFKLIAGFLLIVGLVYLLSPFEIKLIGLWQFIVNSNLIQLPGLPPLVLERQSVVIPLLQHLFVMGNWHLLWFLVIGVLIAGTTCLRTNRSLIAAYLAVGMGVIFLGFMFGFTEFGRWAENATIINRLVLHMVPGMVFVCLITWDKRYKSG